MNVNAELVHLYWDIGRLIDRRQQREDWGPAVIPRLVREPKNELPEVKGFPVLPTVEEIEAELAGASGW